ncbi:MULTISPECIES: TPM domain-containing protein [unclassified Acinetobacter]|uniref:TPM domain-containing protein n=1 Tax=unclassified Acinetobacter TaxID=196816 RepID=UPI0035B98ADF
MQVIHSKPSFLRWLRQLSFVPYFQQRWLNSESKARLTQAITQAEQHHFAEIVLIIENALPLSSAYHQDCRARALDLFGLYRVWDTQYNSGVLIYLNLCEHQLHIVADRGIDAVVSDETWQGLCQQTIEKFKQQQQIDALYELLNQIAMLLKDFHINDHHVIDVNELPNEVIYIR